jgi:hypothetical protein
MREQPEQREQREQHPLTAATSSSTRSCASSTCTARRIASSCTLAFSLPTLTISEARWWLSSSSSALYCATSTDILDEKIGGGSVRR